MKRYPSIDFLRGFAIFMMVFLHTFMRWFDRNSIINNIGSTPLALVLMMVCLLFLGGWAGFFLMVSAIGNMVSMYKGLERNQSAKDLIIKQVVGGFILLAFAILTEAFSGYNAFLGHLVKGDSDFLNYLLYHGFHFETIHAVAWAVILNGIVQGILSIKGGAMKVKRNMKIYAILAIIVVALTPFVWGAFRAVWPGYPHANNPLTGYDWQYAVWGISNAWDFIYRFFLLPWAGMVEPMFPFLAVSFIGSIIGLYISQQNSIHEKEPETKIQTAPLKKGIILGYLMFITGFIWLMILVAGGKDPLAILGSAYDLSEPIFYSDFSWFPLFLMLTGSQMSVILVVFRLVEFRGNSESMAKKTLFFRRFGFVAFSVYNYQFIDVLVVRLVTLIPGMPAYQPAFDAIQIWLPMILIFALWQLVFTLWEKVNYVFSMEWLIAKVSGLLLPIKRDVDKSLPWWKISRLDPIASLHDAEWISIIPKEKIDKEELKESKLSYKMSLAGFLFPLMWFLGISIAKTAQKTEGVNNFNKKGKLISMIGTVLFAVIIIALSVLTLDTLGISL
jgi:hypothetical protein